MSVLKARVNGQWVPLNGSDEVHVGPSDPTLASTELWVDTDEPSVMTDDMRWNTAWGIVALGSMKASPIAAAGASVRVPVTDPLPYTLLTGRRYRIRCNVRAWQPASLPSTGYLVIRRSGTELWDNHSTVSYGLAGMYVDAFISAGDNVAQTWDVVWVSGATATLYTDQASGFFYIEDIGPVSTAVPMVNPIPAWTNVTLQDGATADDPAGHASPPRYRKIGDIVYVEGSCNLTKSQSIPFILPAGYRPARGVRLLLGGHRNGVGGSYYVRCDLGPSGQLATYEIGPTSITDLTLYANFQFSVTP